jgi:hypothetical protein
MSVIARENKKILEDLFPNLSQVFNISTIDWETPNVSRVIIKVLTSLNIKINNDYVASIVPTTRHLIESLDHRVVLRLATLYVSSCNPDAESVVLVYLPKILEIFQDSQSLEEIFGENPNFLCKILMLSDEVCASLTGPFIQKFGRIPDRQLFFKMLNHLNIEDALLVLKPDFLKFCLGTSENCMLFASEDKKGVAIIRRLMQDDIFTKIILDSFFFDAFCDKVDPKSRDFIGIMRLLTDFFHRTYSQMTLKELFRLFEIDMFMHNLLEGCTLGSIVLTEDIILALANTNLSIHGDAIFELLQKYKGKVNFANIAERFSTLSDPRCATPNANRPFRERMILALEQIS